MSQHSDLVQYLSAVEEKLAEQDAKFGMQDSAIAELQKHVAKIDQAQQTINTLIEAFRINLNEEFRRLREGIGVRR